MTFEAQLNRPADRAGDDAWTFLLLPKAVSETLPRRGRCSVDGSLNGHPFRATLEPDGQLSHWLKVSPELQEAAGISAGELVVVEVRPVDEEPDPEMPTDFHEALEAAPAARATWDSTTSIARVDWIHWIVTAKQPATHAKRIRDACEMLAAGKKRACCFDPSGYYSKAFKAPKAAS